MELFDRIVNETVLSGIEPVTLNFTGIYDCYYGNPKAYRTDAEVFCSATGKMGDVLDYIDDTETGNRFCIHNIKKAIYCVNKFIAAGRKTKWISVSGTTAFLTQNDLYSVLSRLFDGENFLNAEKIRLEFDKRIFYADRDKVVKGIADLKVSGIKTVIRGVDAEFPVSALTEIAADAVILSPKTTALSSDRNKPALFSSLIRYIRAMDVEVIADGVETDDRMREMNKAECYGFIPSADYKGKFDVTAAKRDLASALTDKENV